MLEIRCRKLSRRVTSPGTKISPPALCNATPPKKTPRHDIIWLKSNPDLPRMNNFSHTSSKLFAIQIRDRIAQILKVSLTEANSQSIPLGPPRFTPQLEPPAAPASAPARWGPRRAPGRGVTLFICLLLGFLSQRFIEG